MLYSSIDHISSENDWHILEKAHQRACQILGRDPKYHPLAEQVARAVIMFFARGERDYGRLAAMTAKREINLFEFETEKMGTHVRDMSMIMASRPKYFHCLAIPTSSLLLLILGSAEARLSEVKVLWAEKSASPFVCHTGARFEC